MLFMGHSEFDQVKQIYSLARTNLGEILSGRERKCLCLCGHTISPCCGHLAPPPPISHGVSGQY